MIFFFECPGCSHYLDLIFGCVISHTQFWCVFESYQKGKVILPTQPSSPSSWGGFTKSLWWPSWPLSLMLKAELQQVKTEPAEETEARTIQPTAQEPIQPTAQEQLHHIRLCCCFSCSAVSDSLRPIDCSPPGSSAHGDSSGKNIGVGCHSLLQGIFLTQGLKPVLLHCKQILYHLSHQGNPSCTEHRAKWNVRPLVQKLSRVPKQRQQNIKPRAGGGWWCGGYRQLLKPALPLPLVANQQVPGSPGHRGLYTHSLTVFQGHHQVLTRKSGGWCRRWRILLRLWGRNRGLRDPPTTGALQ